MIERLERPGFFPGLFYLHSANDIKLYVQKLIKR